MPDFLFLMESRLSAEQIAAIQQVNAAVADQGNLFLVGGALRNMLSGFPIRDLDFALEGNPAKVVRTIEKLPGVEVIEFDEELRESHFVFAGDVPVSLGQCRSETYTKTGQHPEVRFAGIQEDLRRRDFSMNAIAISMAPASRGLVLDPTNGIGDIERREIRCISNYSLYDDPTRMIRLMRFRTRLHFNVDPKTESQFQSAKEQDLLQYALPERVKAELRDISRDTSPSEILKAVDKEGMTVAFHPKLAGPRLNLPALAKMEKTARWMEEHGLRPRMYNVFMFCLTQKLSAADRAAMARRLQMKKSDAEWLKIEEDGKKLVRVLGGKEGNTPSRAFQLLSAQPSGLLLFVLLQFPQKKVQDKIKNFIAKHRPLREKMPEKELQGLGIEPGTPKYVKILDQLFAAQLDGKVKSRTDQLKYLKKLAG